MSVEFLRVAPAPALRGAVLRMEGYAARLPAPVRFRELPCTHVPLIIDFGAGWWVAGQGGDQGLRLGSFAAGITAAPVSVEHPGVAACVQVDLTALGARRLLGRPLSELADRSVALEDLLTGPAWASLAERLAGAAGWDERFALVERALIDRFADAPGVDREVAWALGRIAAAPGRVAIGALARELGWSHRRLLVRFRDQVGVTPRTLARIARLESVRALLAADPDVGWARAAAASGYCDQPHLAREVRALCAMTPTELRAHEVNSIQDLESAAA